jgi:hypothetical protein
VIFKPPNTKFWAENTFSKNFFSKNSIEHTFAEFRADVKNWLYDYHQRQDWRFYERKVAVRGMLGDSVA